MTDEEQRALLDGFLDWLSDQLSGDPRLTDQQRVDRSDGSLTGLRWTAADNPRVWFEAAVRPNVPQLRIGVLTDDRWKSEDFEEKIQESGDTMSEFVGMGFAEAGLAWHEPTVEHFREEMKHYYFSTPVDFDSVAALNDASLRDRARRMVHGYLAAFGPFLMD